jgi:predicted DNA-binding protein (MmcQ/YjbR family)
MTIDEYNTFCGALAHTTHVVQWGGAHVWKVGGKVFAICWDEGGDDLQVTFKCSDMSYDLLKELPGCRPAPYLASRGMKWIQRFDGTALDDDGLRDYLRASHRIVASGLSKRTQRELGLTVDEPARAGRGVKVNSTQTRARSAR